MVLIMMMFQPGYYQVTPGYQRMRMSVDRLGEQRGAKGGDGRFSGPAPPPQVLFMHLLRVRHRRNSVRGGGWSRRGRPEDVYVQLED